MRVAKSVEDLELLTDADAPDFVDDAKTWSSTSGPLVKWNHERSRRSREPDEDLLEFLGGIDEVNDELAGRQLHRFPGALPTSTDIAAPRQAPQGAAAEGREECDE